MSSIEFQATENDFDYPFDIKTYQNWIKRIILNEAYQLDTLSFVFTSDEKLLEINKTYLNHDTYTDIITFDYCEKTEVINGEILISVDRINENAKKFKVTYLHELSRVMAHGVLHLLGYKDKTSNEKSIMRKKEDACISLLKI